MDWPSADSPGWGRIPCRLHQQFLSGLCVRPVVRPVCVVKADWPGHSQAAPGEPLSLLVAVPRARSVSLRNFTSLPGAPVPSSGPTTQPLWQGEQACTAPARLVLEMGRASLHGSPEEVAEA